MLTICVIRNTVPWAVIAVCYFICPFLLLAIRHMLNKENKRRDAEEHDSTYDNVFVEEKLADGTVEIKKVDKVRMSFVGSCFYSLS